MSEPIVGIDLGTTNSVLAAVIGGQVKVIDIHGHPTLPSCVGLNPSGELIVGHAARNQLVSAPESTVSSIKRKMGEETKVALGGKEFSPEEISSFIVRELKVEGEKALGHPIRKAVITVPAFFNERQRKATQIAGDLAGLEVLRIINEPTAAALAYEGDKSKRETMLVYDLGGGTFDVSLVVVEDGVVEVKASHGDTHLGGDDFDELLVKQAVTHFQELHQVDLNQYPNVLRRLKVIMERAKCRLSDQPIAKVLEEHLAEKRHLDMELERYDYETRIDGLIERTLRCVHQTLADTSLTPRDISKVMLVGGATRTPLVHRRLKERFRLEPRWEINPDLIVAMGAAIQGDILSGKNRHSILVDITPHTFSTAAIAFENGYDQLLCSPIIPRNTPLPATKAEIFSTGSDYQRSIIVSAYQGEDRKPEKNTLIGEFRVEGLSEAPAGNPVIIQFTLDLNGMLKVTAIEKNTKLSKTVTLDTRKKSGELNMEQAKKNIASLLGSQTFAPKSFLGDPSHQEPETASARTQSPTAVADNAREEHDATGMLATAKTLRKRAEQLLSKNISQEDAAEIRQHIHRAAEAVGARDWNKLEQENEALGDLLFYLED